MQKTAVVSRGRARRGDGPRQHRQPPISRHMPRSGRSPPSLFLRAGRLAVGPSPDNEPPASSNFLAKWRPNARAGRGPGSGPFIANSSFADSSGLSSSALSTSRVYLATRPPGKTIFAGHKICPHARLWPPSGRAAHRSSRSTMIGSRRVAGTLGGASAVPLAVRTSLFGIAGGRPGSSMRVGNGCWKWIGRVDALPEAVHAVGPLQPMRAPLTLASQQRRAKKTVRGTNC